jgi:hypothetical protein
MLKNKALRQEAYERKQQKGGDGMGDAAAAGDKQLGSCTAGKMEFTAL